MSEVIGFEDLKKLADELRGMYPPVKSEIGFMPLSIGGMKIIEEPKQPQKIKLSESVMVSDEFRSNFNSWLLARFGRRKSLIKDGEFYCLRDCSLVVGNSNSVMALGSIA